MTEGRVVISETQALLAKESTVLSHSKKWPQHLAALLASLISMATGAVAGWSSPAIPYLQGHMGTEVTNPITDEQASWVGSIVTLGCLVGAIPAGTLSHKLGRRGFLLLLAWPLILGWLLIIYGENNVQQIYLGRFINGLSFGAVTVAVPLYNNEIAEDRVRGSVGVYLDLMLCVGILWSYVVGALSSLYWLSFSCCVIPVVFLLTFYWMPESPVHLLAQGKAEDAEMAIRWLRGARPHHQYDAGPELTKLQRLVDDAEDREKAQIKISDLATFREKLASFSFRSTTTKAVGIAFGLMTFQRLSGVSAVVYYTVDIFRGAGTSIAPTTATIIVGVVSVVASVTSACLVDRLGRRFLLILSDAVMAVSLAVMAVYFAYKESGVDMRALGWLPVVVICILYGIFRVGLGPIPWFMMAEVLPTEVKSWASSVVVCHTWICTFLVTKLFLVTVDYISFAYTFLIMSAIASIGLIFILLYVPETKNKSSEEIRDVISGKYKVIYTKLNNDT
ncbi:facilitated trehalose transporter Tret1-2 homolog isoform X3 [Macrosteles quadrilineatus]|uniref:facilitated trehalose transporter Tret1-2 homolog isoform X3 n=1 Tax=Macrosteles quadrilineatus TaxID=74068 RepID=UPI0023E2C3B5|nr:facilitated trehalose transporter Tret1-2 homolog isoform X3 [Macrosteles quadrilineatus]